MHEGLDLRGHRAVSASEPSADAAALAEAVLTFEAERQAEAEARRNQGDLTSPTSPRYWAARPIERARQLSYCGRMTAEQQARFYCDAARAAEAEARRPRS